MRHGDETLPGPEDSDSLADRVLRLEESVRYIESTLRHTSRARDGVISHLKEQLSRNATLQAQQNSQLQIDIAKLSGELKSQMESVRADVHKSESSVTRWVVVAGATVVAVLGGLGFISKSADHEPRAPTAISAPYVPWVPTQVPALPAPTQTTPAARQADAPPGVPETK